MIHYVLGSQLLLRVSLLINVLLLLFRLKSIKDGHVVVIIILLLLQSSLVHCQLSIRI